MTDLVMDRGATLSSCGLYRYVLWRIWDARRALMGRDRLNPSIADAEIDDATIRVVTGRALRMGYGGVLMSNMFALRATNPLALRTADDPVGPLADQHLAAHIGRCDFVLAAWGDDAVFRTPRGINRERARAGAAVRPGRYQPLLPGSHQGRPATPPAAHPLRPSADALDRRPRGLRTEGRVTNLVKAAATAHGQCYGARS